MGFLRRLLGRDDDARAGNAEGSRTTGGPAASEPPIDPDDEERQHELELARFEQARTTELMRRQQRYGDRSWTPPPQGGPERSDSDEVDAG